MPTPQFENFQEMVSNVKEEFPLFDAHQIKRKINDNLRNIIARRPWSGLVKYSSLAVPSAYNTGAITPTLNSSVITGSSTAWPVNDLANTTLAGNGVFELGVQEATPTSMSGILPGTWLTIDGGNAGEEAVFVVRADATTFQANFAKVHSAGVTITRSSLAGRQIRVSGDTPFFTITGVTSTTRLLIDRPWASVTSPGQSYQIVLAYVSFGQDVKQLLTVVNPVRQRQLQLHWPKSALDSNDPKRASTGDTWMAVFHESDPAGSPLFELYPRVTTAQAFMFHYVKHWTPLVNDYDLLPNGIRSDVITKRVKAEAARWPGHRPLQGGIYYDLKLSSTLMLESELEINQMAMDDDNTSIMTMMWQHKHLPPMGSTFWQDKDADSYYDIV